MGEQGYQPPGPVIFTIGDSSDCDSASSTGTSISALSLHQNDSSNPRKSFTHCHAAANSDNPFHKYHYQTDSSLGGPMSIPTFTPTTVKSVSTTRGLGGGGGGRGESCNRNEVILQRTPAEEINVSVGSDQRRRTRSHDHSQSSTTRMGESFGVRSSPHLSDIDFQASGGGGGGDQRSREGCWRNWREARILFSCAIVQLFCGLTISLQAPFYPLEAEKKGASATEYAFVFGVFEMTVFVVAPFFASNIHKWNERVVFHLGIFVAASSSIAFGVLDNIVDEKYFIAACVLVRALEAVGEAAVVAASFVIVASVFPHSIDSIFGFVEMFHSGGLIAGPILGSSLYILNGYSLPFMVNGGMLLAIGVLNFLILPSVREISEIRSKPPEHISSLKSYRLLGSGPVFVSAVAIVIGAMSISYLQATLEPHLRQFQLTQLSIGAILIINVAVFTVVAPQLGIISEKIAQLKLITFCGFSVLVCGFSLIGPIPILPFTPKVWLIALGLVLQGIGLGAILTSSCISIKRIVLANGLPDTPTTHGLVGNLWTSMFALGSSIGPLLSGILQDNFGFSTGTLSIVILSVLMMFVLLLFLCISRAEIESISLLENEPLLPDSATTSASVYSEHEEPIPSTSAAAAARTQQQRQANSYGSV